MSSHHARATTAEWIPAGTLNVFSVKRNSCHRVEVPDRRCEGLDETRGGPLPRGRVARPPGRTLLTNGAISSSLLREEAPAAQNESWATSSSPHAVKPRSWPLAAPHPGLTPPTR